MSTETTPLPHEDPDSPAARARRDAEAAWQEAYGRDPNTPPPEEPSPVDPPVEPPPAPEPEPSPRTELHLRQPGDRPADPAPAQPEDPVVQERARYEAELRKANDTIAGMRGNIDQLRGQIDLLARQRQQADPVPVREEPSAPRLVTDEEAKAYGTDLLDVVGRRAQEVYEPIIGKLMQRIDGLENTLAGMGRHVVQSAQMTLGQVLAQEVGDDWNKQNNDPKFLAWLASEDPISGLVRQQLLITARDSGNASRVANLFNAYRRETGEYAGQRGPAATSATTVTPASNGGQPAPGGTGGKPGKVPLTALVAPGRSRTAPPAPAGQDDVPLMTEGEINEHYRRSSLGQVSKDEKKAFEARLAAAMVAGKVEVRPKH